MAAALLIEPLVYNAFLFFLLHFCNSGEGSGERASHMFVCVQRTSSYVCVCSPHFEVIYKTHSLYAIGSMEIYTGVKTVQ